MQNADIAEKPSTGHDEPDLLKGTAHDAAARGQAATDRYGVSLVTFDPKAEARLRRKIDLCIVPTVALLYLFCFIDRANIGSMSYSMLHLAKANTNNLPDARLAGLEDDLMLTGYDYSTVLSVFYVSYIIFEIPSNLACKYFGPGWFIPIVSLGFGITSIGTAFCQNLSSICGVRFLLGVFEAGTLYFLLLFARLRTVQVGGRRGKGSRFGSWGRTWSNPLSSYCRGT